MILRAGRRPLQAAVAAAAQMSLSGSSRPLLDRTATTTARTTTTQSHYQSHTADSYESAFFYEPGPYNDYLCQLCRQGLQITSTESTSARVLLDIGGGTGSFTRRLIQDTPHRAIVVDPFLPPQAAVNENDVVQFVAASAESFVDSNSDPYTENDAGDFWKRGYHQVLLKEVVHHFPASQRVAIFRGLHQGLETAAATAASDCHTALLIVTRPQLEIDYPLWEAARTVWAQHQPSQSELLSELTTAGFVSPSSTIESYPCTIPLERWQGMVRRRFWSTFANFTDAELEAACQAMAETERHRIDSDGNLHFEDRLLFISAQK
jgi:hypothetical protein